MVIGCSPIHNVHTDHLFTCCWFASTMLMYRYSYKSSSVHWVFVGSLTHNVHVLRQLTCSQAVGSRSRMACAALLFLVDMAIANGDMPCLSLTVRSRRGCDMRREMMMACWFMIAWWIGALPSASCNNNKSVLMELTFNPT